MAGVSTCRSRPGEPFTGGSFKERLATKNTKRHSKRKTRYCHVPAPDHSSCLFVFFVANCIGKPMNDHGSRRICCWYENPFSYLSLTESVPATAGPRAQVSGPSPKLPHSSREPLYSFRDIPQSFRGFLYSLREVPHSSREFLHSLREFLHSFRELPHSIREVLHSLRGFPDSSRELPHSSRGFLQSVREVLH